MKPKVLGREFEGEPFFKRVSLNNNRKNTRSPKIQTYIKNPAAKAAAAAVSATAIRGSPK